MEYIYLLFAIMIYFPLILADKLGSEGTEEKAMLFKYSFYRSLIGVVFGGLILIITGSKIHLDLYTVLTSLLFGLMLGLCMLVTFYSMQVTTVAISSVFKAASVIIPCIFGALFCYHQQFINILQSNCRRINSIFTFTGSIEFTGNGHFVTVNIKRAVTIVKAK